MHRSENFRRVTKIFIVVFLCSEMQSSFTQPNTSSKSYLSIIYGVEATPENAKHQASIRVTAQDRNFGEGHICSGAIIAPSVVLTVAHCIFNYDNNTPRHPSELKVVMGTLNRYQHSKHTIVYGVTHVYQPSTFDSQTLRDNIAILMLERDIPEEATNVQPITFNIAQMHADTNMQAHAEDALFEVTSWGATEMNVPSTNLMLLNATQLSDQMCSKNYGSFYGLGMFCIDFKHTESEVCPSDAGAPLLYKNQLIGLTSYGHGCAVKGFPAVYTDVAYHSKWIQDIIGNGTNQNSSIWGISGLLLLTIYTLKRSKLLRF